MAGAAMQDIPGTKAHDVSQLIGTLKANVGFDALNRMRQNSPTGGALGQVSERELTFLQSTIASLEQSQGEEQFLENLALVKDAFDRVIHGPQGGAPAPAPAAAPRPSPFATMDRAGLMGVNPATLQGAALDAYESALDRAINGTRPMSEQLARIEAKRAALAGAGTDPIQGQGTPGGPSAFPEQSARMAAIQRRKAELQAQMDHSESEWKAQTATNNWRFPDQAEPVQAGMGGPHAPQTPQRQTDPAMPPRNAGMMPGREMRTQGAPTAARDSFSGRDAPMTVCSNTGSRRVRKPARVSGIARTRTHGTRCTRSGRDRQGNRPRPFSAGRSLGRITSAFRATEMLGDFRPQARAVWRAFRAVWARPNH